MDPTSPLLVDVAAPQPESSNTAPSESASSSESAPTAAEGSRGANVESLQALSGPSPLEWWSDVPNVPQPTMREWLRVMPGFSYDLALPSPTTTNPNPGAQPVPDTASINSKLDAIRAIREYAAAQQPKALVDPHLRSTWNEQPNNAPMVFYQSASLAETTILYDKLYAFVREEVCAQALATIGDQRVETIRRHDIMDVLFRSRGRR